MSAVAALVGAALGFVTIAQQYGAQYPFIAAIMNHTAPGYALGETHNILDRLPQAQSGKRLGRIWHMPADPTDTAGLGGGIAYAWDPTLCDKIMPKFREGLFFYDKFIDCGQIKQAFSRGLQAWTRNHRMLKFVDVTSECEKPPNSLEPRNATKERPAPVDCDLVEMWVTHVGAEDARGAVGQSNQSGEVSSSGFPVALAEGYDDFTRNRAQYTKRKQSFDFGLPVTSRAAFRLTNGQELDDLTIERFGANLKFGVGGDVCWYLDSSFCARFHEWKKYAASSQEVEMILNLVCYVLVFFGLFTCLFKCRIFGSCHRAAKRKRKGNRSCSLRKRCFHIYEEAAQWSVIWTAIQCCMIILPFPIFNEVFMPCFECFDFEAAAVHEVGHVLGLSHPDSAREKVRTALFTPGDNVYSDVLNVARDDTIVPGTMEQPPHSRPDKPGRPPVPARPLTRAEHACKYPWNYVHNNTPPGAVLNEHGCRIGESTSYYASCVGIRQSIMQSFTQFNPNVCLSQDDLEAIQTVYPDCDMVITEPICYRIYLNLGFVRVAVYALVPLILVFIVLLLLQSALQVHNRQELLDTRQDLQDAARGNILAKFRMANQAAKEENRKHQIEMHNKIQNAKNSRRQAEASRRAGHLSAV